MGVDGLHTFIHKKVPLGTFRIDIRNEIRKYYDSSITPNPPPPVIVVDLMSFVYPFCTIDRPGVICGGRFNEIYRRMNQLFSELSSSGVKLHFFNDGLKRRVIPDIWCERKEKNYQNLLMLFDAVDEGADISSISHATRLPMLYIATLRRAAMNHGQVHWAVTKECDQEMAIFANKCQALAILTDDTDFLIYEGTWRLWRSSDLNLNQLTTVECNRVELARFLGLRPSQMPLLATLVGNDVVNSMALKRFHCYLGKLYNKITNVANFICCRSVDATLTMVLRVCGNIHELKNLFQESLYLYQVNIKALIEISMSAKLPSRRIPLFYQVWNCTYVKCKPGVTDLRQTEIGEQVPQLKLFLLLRMSGIILHQRQMEGDIAKQNVMIKLCHDKKHAQHSYGAVFPFHVNLPSIEELLSNDPVTCTDLEEIKLQLVCWIASDSIDHHRMEAIPRSLQITILTLYYLLETRTLRLFEADLILQVVHDVTFFKYDPQSVAYPRKLDSRPFRVAFVFQDIYALIAKAFSLVGLTDSVPFDPAFDGVLFHNWYEEWSGRQPEIVEHLEEIQQWRIYQCISAGLAGGAAP